MAALPSTLQLLFLGALISPVYLQDACQPIQNAAPGFYNLSVNPIDYKANTTYNVTISGAMNSSVLLQALDTQNSSVGQWENPVVNCSNGLSVKQQNITGTATVQWTSPVNGTAPVEIRVFVTLSNGSTSFQNTTLNTAPTAPPVSTTRTPINTTINKTTPTRTTNSVSTVQASSFLLAAVHLLSVLVTGKLFS